MCLLIFDIEIHIILFIPQFFPPVYSVSCVLKLNNIMNIIIIHK